MPDECKDLQSLLWNSTCTPKHIFQHAGLIRFSTQAYNRHQMLHIVMFTGGIYRGMSMISMEFQTGQRALNTACRLAAEGSMVAGLWEAGKKKWVKRLLAHRDGELDSNLAEAMDLCQEAARQARSAGEVHPSLLGMLIALSVSGEDRNQAQSPVTMHLVDTPGITFEHLLLNSQNMPEVHQDAHAHLEGLSACPLVHPCNVTINQTEAAA